MIKQVKVNLSSVKQYKEATLDIVECTKDFAKGVADFDNLINETTKIISNLHESKSRMEVSHEILTNKINDIKADLSAMTERCNALKIELDSLKAELSSTPKTISILENGKIPIEIPNPVYTALLAKIEVKNSQIAEINGRIVVLRQRLENAMTLDGKIRIHSDKITKTINVLEGNRKDFKNHKTQFEEIKKQSDEEGCYAWELLNRIEKIVSDYLLVKMSYISIPVSTQMDILNCKNENSLFERSYDNYHNSQTANNQQSNTDDDSETETTSDIQPTGKEDELSKLQREKRYAMTPNGNNPVNGYWTGERGNSKYIVSNRSSIGVKANELLKIKYRMDGIEYIDGEPVFEPCSEAVVKIVRMTKHRSNYSEKIQLSSNNIKSIDKFGNFTQADIECARVWNDICFQGKNDWAHRDVERYRKMNCLEWHEKCDCETMVLVYSAIHKCATHAGGVSMCKIREELYGGTYNE